MKLRTKIQIPQNNQPIHHESKILFTGSCFAENIGEKFLEHQFDALVNPLGIAYNPISLFSLLIQSLEGTVYKEFDFVHHNEQWHSPEHHSDFSNADLKVVLEKINSSILLQKDFLKSVDFLFISLGSSWVYRHIEKDKIYNNCHKIPNKNFNKELLSIEELNEKFGQLQSLLVAINPKVQLIFTVSPIRHLKDGLIENNRSKSLLNQFVHQAGDQYPNTHYFPSFEIMMDDLRDYRFYTDDLLHPSPMAIEYIWEKFTTTYFQPETIELCQELQEIKKAESHRPFNPESEEYQRFLKNLQQRKAALKSRYAFLF